MNSPAVCLLLTTLFPATTPHLEPLFAGLHELRQSIDSQIAAQEAVAASLGKLANEYDALLGNGNRNPPEAIKPNEKASMYFQLGLTAFGKENWNESYANFRASWQAMNTSLELGLPAPRDSDKKVIDLVDILDYTQYTAFKAGDTEAALAIAKLALKVVDDAEDRMTFSNLVKFYKSQLPLNETADAVELMAEKADYYEMCDDAKAEAILARLAARPDAICRINNRNLHPLFTLSPVKEEVFSWQPYVVLFHDIIHNSEIDLIKALSADKFTDSNVISLAVEADPTKQFIQDSYRKAQTAWVFDSWVLKKLTTRIEAVTSLSANSFDGAENYQVTRYPTAGHNAPHYDVILGAGAHSTGDRIATLLLYLSDVEQGGGTLFNKLQIRVAPQIGSGLFWHNCHQNETYDVSTLHSACPILRGEKMVANRWFRYRGQFRHRLCGLVPNETFTEHSML